MKQDHVKTEVQDQVAYLTLNRPEVHNAFSQQTIHELILALKNIADQAQIRALVLQATGKNFSAGADLNWMKSAANNSSQENKADAEMLSSLMYVLESMPIPTIAKVQGGAYGGAVGLVCCCDIVVAATNATFKLSEVKLGIIPAAISPFVIRAIGQRQARRYFLTAESISCDQATQIGLVHEQCDQDQLDQVISDMLKHLLSAGPQAIRHCKDLICHVSEAPLDDTLREYTSEYIAMIRASDEGQEGLSAFLEKRPPAWTLG